MKRWPWLTSPASRPWSANRTGAASTLATSQRIGREKRSPNPSPQRIVLEKRSPSIRCAARAGTTSATSRSSARSPVHQKARSPGPARTSRSAGVSPWDRAKPATARSGAPSAGPRTGGRATRNGQGTPARPAKRRGATQVPTGPWPSRPASPSPPPTRPGAWSRISRHALEGSSSQPTSRSTSGNARARRGRRRRERGLGRGGLIGRPGLDPRAGDAGGQRAHAPDVPAALRDADDAAGVQQVEDVAALEHLVVGRGDQPGVEAAPALPLVVLEVAE